MTSGDGPGVGPKAKPTVEPAASPQVALSFTVTILLLARGLILLPLLTKNLALPQYGMWAELLAAIGLLVPLAGLGLENGAIRFWPASAADRSRIAAEFQAVYWCVGLSGGLVMLAAITIGAVVGRLSDDPQAAVLIAFAGIAVLVALLERYAMLYFRATRRLRVYSALQLLDGYLAIVLTVIAVALGTGLIGVAGAWVASQGVVALIASVLVIRDIGFVRPRFALLGRYFGFGLPLLPSVLFIWILNSSDRFVLATVSGHEEVAVYSVAYQWGAYSMVFFGPIFTVLQPRAAQLWDRGEHADALRMTGRAVRFGIGLTLPLLVALATLANPLLHLLTTDAYVRGAPLVGVVGLAYLIFMIGSVGETVVGLQKRTRRVPLMYATAAVINLVLTVSLTPFLGATAAALATLISFAVLAALQLRLAAEKGSFVVDPGFLVRCLLASAAMAAVILILAPASLIGMMLAGSAGAITYLAVVTLLGALTADDVKFLLFAARLRKQTD